MQRHPQYGADIIARVDFLQDALPIVLSHHERVDGRGYPQGLSGAAIPIGARIFAIADVFDALTTVRPYKSAWPAEQARAQIEQDAGAAFDPQMVEAFVRVFDQVLDVMRGKV